MSIDKMGIFYYIIHINQEDKIMILQDLQMSQLKSYNTSSENNFLTSLFIFNCLVWIVSVIVNIIFYNKVECTGTYLILNYCFSGMLFISLLSFFGIVYTEDNVIKYKGYDRYEKLPPKGKSVLFLYTCYYCIFICSTPLVVIVLPLYIFKKIFYDLPSMILDRIFAEEPVKENVLKNYEKLLKPVKEDTLTKYERLLK